MSLVPDEGRCKHVPTHQVYLSSLGQAHTVGGYDLSAWQVAPGICWIQTRNPRHADRLRRRKGSRRVAFSALGPFLQIFEEKKPLSWAERLIERYLAKEHGTCKGSTALNAAQTHSTEQIDSAHPVPSISHSEARAASTAAKHARLPVSTPPGGQKWPEGCSPEASTDS